MAKNHSYVLGINAYDHDVSACLLRDGEIAVAISKERLTRKKHDSGFYDEVVNYCLDAEGILLNDVDLVVRNCYMLPVEDMERRLLQRDEPDFLDEDERKLAVDHSLFLSTSDKVVTISHHLAHAYSAFAVCPFENGAVMIVDGVGSYRADMTETGKMEDDVDPLARESESYYTFENSKIETLKKMWMHPCRGFLSDEFYSMPGLGAVYSRVSTYIFGDWNNCGEVMGLAPYGRSGRVKPLFEIKDGVLDFREWDEEFNQPWLEDSRQAWTDSPSLRHWKDIAWQVQDDTEKALLDRAIWLRETTGAKNLCLAGGVALNCVANGRIAREAGFDNVWIQPAAGDDGIAIGCAYYGHLALQNKPRSFVMNHAFLGIEYNEKDLHEIMNRRLVRLETKNTTSKDICSETAKILSEGHVIGWFQGRSEYGPRALGNRSILADPRTAGMKDRVNTQVKHRQSFRPFAPIVLAEKAKDIFEGDEESPFMLLAKKVKPEWRDKIPAVTHIDGTARVQTIRQEDNEYLYRLLKEFDAITGVPVIMNTSFNIRGEPIVETPRDAVNCFLDTGIDYLILHDKVISKNWFHKMFHNTISRYREAKKQAHYFDFD